MTTSKIQPSANFEDIINTRVDEDRTRADLWLGRQPSNDDLIPHDQETLDKLYEGLRGDLLTAVIQITGADGGPPSTLADLDAVCLQGNASDVLRRSRRVRGGTLTRRLVHSASRREARAAENTGVYARRFKSEVVNSLAAGLSNDPVVPAT